MGRRDVSHVELDLHGGNGQHEAPGLFDGGTKAVDLGQSERLSTPVSGVYQGLRADEGLHCLDRDLVFPDRRESPGVRVPQPGPLPAAVEVRFLQARCEVPLRRCAGERLHLLDTGVPSPYPP